MYIIFYMSSFFGIVELGKGSPLDEIANCWAMWHH